MYVTSERERAMPPTIGQTRFSSHGAVREIAVTADVPGMTIKPSYLRTYVIWFAGLALGVIVAGGLFGWDVNRLGLIAAGGMIGALFAASRATEREKIEFWEGVVHVPGRWRRRSIPVDRLDRIKSQQRSVLDRLRFERWLWSSDGHRIRINLLAHRHSDVQKLLRLLGCE
jgi:hypothetical protein